MCNRVWAILEISAIWTPPSSSHCSSMPFMFELTRFDSNDDTGELCKHQILCKCAITEQVFQSQKYWVHLKVSLLRHTVPLPNRMRAHWNMHYCKVSGHVWQKHSLKIFPDTLAPSILLFLCLVQHHLLQCISSPHRGSILLLHTVWSLAIYQHILPLPQ